MSNQIIVFHWRVLVLKPAVLLSFLYMWIYLFIYFLPQVVTYPFQPFDPWKNSWFYWELLILCENQVWELTHIINVNVQPAGHWL